ncbi:MAG: TetR/AcrR family transcriptional regulator [Steroidobacteraceae bacterium]
MSGEVSYRHDFDVGREQKPTVPDPAAPFMDHLAVRARGQRWLTQRIKRSRILAATRMCMAQTGADGVQLRPIAAHCGLSVQSIYNIVGGRAQVLYDSSEDWVEFLAADARKEHAGALDSCLLFGIVEKFWATPLRWPDYVTQAAATSATPVQPLNEAFVLAATKVLYEEIVQLRHRGLLRASVDPRSLAHQLTLVVHALICSWTVDRYDVKQYRNELINGPALMMLGAVCGDERTRLENCIDRRLR